MSRQVKPGGPEGPAPEPPSQDTEEIDAEAFKDILKIERSEEAPQKKKRQLKRSEEEGEEKKQVEKEPPSSEAFDAFMTDSNQDSLFDVKTPQTVTESSMSPSPLSVRKSRTVRSADQVDLEEDKPLPIPKTKGKAPVAKRAPKKKTDVSTFEVPKKKPLDSAIPTTLDKSVEESVPTAKKTLSATKKKAIASKIHARKKAAVATRAKEAKIQAEKESLVTEVGSLESGAAQGEIPAPQEGNYAFLQLPPQVYEIFEKMVGVMTIEQYGDISTTTVTINMENSVFNGAQIVIDHYSTAPNAFNIQLQGSDEAVNYFSANLDTLNQAFSQSNLNYDINLKTPILSEKYRKKEKKTTKRVERKSGDSL